MISPFAILNYLGKKPKIFKTTECGPFKYIKLYWWPRLGSLTANYCNELSTFARDKCVYLTKFLNPRFST